MFSLKMLLLLLPGFFLRHLQTSSPLLATFRLKNGPNREKGMWVGKGVGGVW